LQLNRRSAPLIIAAVLATAACSQGQKAANQNQQENAPNGQTQPRDQTRNEPRRKQPSDVIRVKVSDGVVRASADPAEVTLGEKVTISVTSDASDEIHVHVYDRLKEIEAGQTVTISFVADIPGAFEIELEEAGIELLELRVQ
jgi:hypothetical protein